MFYAVKRGRQVGVFKNWEECRDQVKDFPGASFKKFRSLLEAEAYVTGGVAIAEPEEAVKRIRYDEDEDEDMGDDVVYCDGACKGNGQPGSVAGIGVWWGVGDPRNKAERCPGAQTNNRAELFAIARVLETAPIPKNRLVIKTDSKYAIQCLEEWIPNWLHKGWRTSAGEPVKNAPLIHYVYTLLKHRTASGQRIKFKHVRGHSGVVGNNAADALAGEGSAMGQIEEYDWDALRLALNTARSDDTNGAVDKPAERSWEIPVEGDRDQGKGDGKGEGKAEERTYEIEFGEGEVLKSVKIVGTKLIVQATTSRTEPTIRVKETKPLYSTVNPSQIDFDQYNDVEDLLLDDEELAREALG